VPLPRDCSPADAGGLSLDGPRSAGWWLTSTAFSARLHLSGVPLPLGSG